jgi:hypothetical protein
MANPNNRGRANNSLFKVTDRVILTYVNAKPGDEPGTVDQAFMSSSSAAPLQPGQRK